MIEIKSSKHLRTSKRIIEFKRGARVMGILNTTPDSFSDGGKFLEVSDAIRQAERLVEEGADIIDIGGESTRPGSERVDPDIEINRVIPVIEETVKRFDVPVSIDTSKAVVAEAAIEAGAEIINDISGLRFDPAIGSLAAQHGTGLVLMHLIGDFRSMHRRRPQENVMSAVSKGFKKSIKTATGLGVKREQICLDIGIGFSKTQAQNLELVAKLDKLSEEFQEYPILFGGSKKSFIGKILDRADPEERASGSQIMNAIAVLHGANIVRVHDVMAAKQALRVVEAIRNQL